MKKVFLGIGIAAFLILGAANINTTSASQNATEIVNFDKNPQDDGKNKKKEKKSDKKADKKATKAKACGSKSDCTPKTKCSDKKKKACCSSKKGPKK